MRRRANQAERAGEQELALLERPHYDLVFHALAVRNTANYSPPIFDAQGPHDGKILLGLLRRLLAARHGALHPETLKARALEHTPIEVLLDAGLRIGPYGRGIAGIKKKGLPGTLSLRVLKDEPHGVNLGPLMPFFTRGQRIDAAPEIYESEVDRARVALEVPAPELLLIGRRQLRNNNSWMHNAPSLAKGRERCTLLVHPEDATRYALAHGGEAKITTRVGEVQVPVAISDEVMRGVVSLPHGFGHHREGTRVPTASQRPGVSFNDLSDTSDVDALTGTAILNGVPIESLAPV